MRLEDDPISLEWGMRLRIVSFELSNSGPRGDLNAKKEEKRPKKGLLHNEFGYENKWAHGYKGMIENRPKPFV